jgi:hypothetical protein
MLISWLINQTHNRPNFKKKKDTIVHALTFQAVEQRCQLSRTPRALAVRPSSR